VIDLHAHSTASDGTLSPRELVELAAARGLKALALTDHDTVAGLAEAQAAAAGKEGFRFVPGVEIEVDFKPGEFHLLGLDLDVSRVGGAFAYEMLGLEKARAERNRQMVAMMRDDGIALSWDELLEEAGGGMVGRPHIANVLVRKRVAKNRQDAFDRFIGRGRPYYAKKAALSLEKARDLVRSAGALAFVAHPLSLFVSWKRIRELFGEWKELNIDGIEAWHPTARVGECRRLEAMAAEFGFRCSAGSDYHGGNRVARVLGHTAGSIRIDDRYLAAIER
jgi:hypothetical protein